MTLVLRKPVFVVFDQVRHKQACSASETSLSLEILDIASRGILLSKQQTAKALMRLHGCGGYTIMILSFRTDRSEQTMQIQIRLLLEQSDQGLHCLHFCLHLLDALLYGKTMLFKV